MIFTNNYKKNSQNYENEKLLLKKNCENSIFGFENL